MKAKVIDYKILSGSEVGDVERQVREHIQQQAGWRPSGSLVHESGKFFQPIARLQD